MRIRARWLAALIVATVALGATAATAKAPATGKFKATGKVAFKFSVKKGTCVSPPKNLHNPKARPGKARKGLCFYSGDDPHVNPVCAAGSISGLQALVSSFSGLRLSKSGSMHLRAYSYGSDPNTPTSFTELSIHVSGKRASGFVRTTDDVFVNGASVTCDTGMLTFSARRT
jgi:hypothetical protein